MLPTVPAYCAECNLWSSSGIALTPGARNVQFEDCKATCRECRKPVPIPDGTYNALAVTVHELRYLDRDKLERLRQIMRDAAARDTRAEELQKIITKESPDASGLNKILTQENVKWLVTAILTVIALLIAYKSIPKDKTTEDKVSEEKIIQGVFEKITSQSKSAVTEPKAKQRVNAPCSCGSGRKSKKCCGSRK